MKKIIIIGVCAAFVFLLLAFTCPNRQEHEEAITYTLSSFVNEEMDKDETNAFSWLGSLFVKKIAGVFIDSRLKVNDYILFSVGEMSYKGKTKTIGDNKVAVPEAFFKVVLCMKGEPKAIGFIYKNGDGNRPKGDYANSVDQVERITGIDFFPSLPDNIEKKVEAECNPDDWDL